MSSNETNIDSMVTINNYDDQTIVVAFYVKDNAVIADEACRAVGLFDIGQCLPVGVSYSSIPCS